MSQAFQSFGSKSRVAVGREHRPLVLPLPRPGIDSSDQSYPGPQLKSVPANGCSQPSPLPLIKQLCEALNAQQISYCHWKSNWRLSRWLTGEGDLDLLVASADAKRFASAALTLGFVEAGQTQNEEMPGVFHLYGWDTEAEKFVHLHVYHRLLVGHDLTANYHLPIEALLLQSASKVGLVPVPQPEFELLVFVLRKVLSSGTAETILRRMVGRPADCESTAKELEYLEAHTDRAKVYDILKQTFPNLQVALFERCLQSLRLESSLWNRTMVRPQLEKTLKANARRGRRVDGVLKSWRLLSRVFRKRVIGRAAGKHFVNGGALVALVGGDGAGKTTAVNAVRCWLDEHFVVRTFHFGKPHRSAVTIAVIIALRGRALVKARLRRVFAARGEDYSGRYPGYLQMIRWVCAARDRYRVYLKARRFANNGGIAICDRYLVPGIFLMDGPNIARSFNETQLTRLRKALLKAESRYYLQIMQPDLLLVLRVDPEVAVRRKTDEPEQHVRTRSEEIWRHDWSYQVAHLVDASQPPAAVLSDLQARIWQQI
jgi:thymidylate kinase